MVEKAVKPVLMIGGSGVVGARAARILRALHPSLPLAIAGRDQDKAARLAEEVGHAWPIAVDLGRADLGLPSGGYGAVVTLLKDHALNAMRFAQANHIPYILCSEAVFEIGPIAALHAHRPDRSAVLMASNWMVCTATMPALEFADTFETVERVAIGAVFDPADPSGPMSQADWDRSVSAVPRPLLLDNGHWRWVDGALAARPFAGVDGHRHEGQALGVLDLLSIADRTGARSVRFDIALEATAASRRGELAAHEIIVEVEGRTAGGTVERKRREIVHPEGSAQLAATGIATVIERMIGLAGEPAPEPGLYLPESLIDPVFFNERLRRFGATIR